MRRRGFIALHGAAAMWAGTADWLRMGFVGGLLVLVMVAANATRAQGDYPNSPVRLISDSGPGGVDSALRIVADGMSRYWKQQVMLVNQPGAAGSIRCCGCKTSRPNGATASTVTKKNGSRWVTRFAPDFALRRSAASPSTK